MISFKERRIEEPHHQKENLVEGVQLWIELSGKYSHLSQIHSCFDSYQEVAKYIPDVSEYQVARKHGYRRCQAMRKPYLSPKNKADRVRWTKEISPIPLDNIIWTDEVSIELGQRPRQFVTRCPLGKV